MLGVTSPSRERNKWQWVLVQILVCFGPEMLFPRPGRALVVSVVTPRPAPMGVGTEFDTNCLDPSRE